MVVPFIVIKFLSPEYPRIVFAALIAEILLIVIFNVLKNKHIIFSAVPALVMVSTVLIRIFCQSNSYTSDIPLETVPMIMMAFDAEYRENAAKAANKNNKEPEPSLIVEILKGTISFMIYVMLNGHSLYI